MKRFIVSVLCVTVFCIGLGALVDKAGATFKSDEKALALIKQARIAIGGEQSIAEVRSMIIKGNTSLTFKSKDGSRTESGETEIAMQLPDKLSKMVKIGRHEGAVSGEGPMTEKHDVIIMRDGEGHGGAVAGPAGEKKVLIKKIEGENVEVEKVISDDKGAQWSTSDGKTILLRKVPGDAGAAAAGEPDARHKRIMLDRGGPGEMGHRQNELLRTTLSLLLTAPEGIDVSYTFAGEGDVDGTGCNIVNAEFGGSNFKLFLSKATSLPVMLSYSGHAMPNVMFFKTKEPAAAAGEPAKADVVFTRKLDAPDMAEVQVRFADYRSVNGVQLPYRWTTSVGGQTTEVFDVTGYELNPANIAEKFQNQRTFVRTKREGQ